MGPLSGGRETRVERLRGTKAGEEDGKGATESEEEPTISAEKGAIEGGSAPSETRGDEERSGGGEGGG